MKKIVIALAVIIALSGGIYGALVLLNQPKPSQTNVQALQQTTEPITIQNLHEAVNAKRREAGVPELVLDDRLNQSALAKAEDMVNDGYFQHNDPTTGKTGVSYIFDYMPECKVGSENQQQTDSNDLKVTVKSFMDSKPHREAMLNPKFTLVGYGIYGDKLVQHMC